MSFAGVMRMCWRISQLHEGAGKVHPWRFCDQDLQHFQVFHVYSYKSVLYVVYDG